MTTRPRQRYTGSCTTSSRSGWGCQCPTIITSRGEVATTGGEGEYADGGTMLLPASVKYINSETLDRAFAIGNK